MAKKRKLPKLLNLENILPKDYYRHFTSLGLTNNSIIIVWYTVFGLTHN